MSTNTHLSKAHKSVVKHIKGQVASLRKQKTKAKSKDKRADLSAAIKKMSAVQSQVVGGCESGMGGHSATPRKR